MATLTEVEHVATWVGLFLAVTGIILAIVSIAFTWAVNARAERLNDETIRALASIERDVKQVSDDTRELIREAWTKMLGGVREIHTIAADAAAEVAEAQAAASQATTNEPANETIEGVRTERDSLREALDKANRALRRVQDSSGSDPVESLRRVSPEARELVRIIFRYGAITVEQTTEMSESSIPPLIDELRDAGLLMRIVRISRSRQESKSVLDIPVRLRSQFGTALRLFDRDEAVSRSLMEQLRMVDYPGARADRVRTDGTPTAVPPGSPGQQ